MMNWFKSIEFLHAWVLWTIPVLIVAYVIWLYFRYKKQYPTLTLSSTKSIKDVSSLKGSLIGVLPFLRLLTLIFILIALARPQTTSIDEKSSTFGIDVAVSIDISASMLAKDFTPNRLEVAKEVAGNFIEQRVGDRFSLVIFAGESFTQVPLTTDKIIIQEQLSKIQHGVLSDGTAIGMGIGTAINRLKDSNSESKVIILMTDGVNNAGLIDPILATEAAMQFDIKIYTIGIGSKGTALMPAYLNDDGSYEYDYMPVEIDEELLTKIAEMTGGQYYRAEDEKTLESIYAEIDELEKTEIETSQIVRVSEEFYPLAAMAIFLLFFEFLLRYTFFRSFP